MVKFGQLYLQKGKYKDKQNISEKWMQQSTVYQSDFFKIKKHGYHWWIQKLFIDNKELLAYRAEGMGGQSIFVLPEYEMLIVLTGGNYSDFQNSFQLVQMISKYILPQ